MKLDEQVRDHSADIIEQLVVDVLSKDAVEIRFEFEDNDQWSMITVHIYEEDREISLRLHSGDSYDLYVGYYDDEDEFFEIVQPLTDEEKMIIPDKLKRLMGKVLSDEQGMRLPSSLISK